MGRHTYMWVSILNFSLAMEADDRGVIDTLVRSRFYAHSYAWPFDLDEVVEDPAIHGRWLRERICADRFDPCAPAEAERVLRSWANDQDWTDPTFRQPPDAQARLQNVIDSLGTAPLYRLNNPGPDDEHEWGSVVGQLGFHEFVCIDRSNASVRLIVAADD